MIALEFASFEEMKGFAQKLLGTEAAVNQKTPEPVKMEKAEKVEPKMAPAEQKSIKEPNDEAPVEELKKETTTYSLEDVRARLAALNKGGKRTEVKELLASFGAEKLSEIGSEHYDTLMEKAEVL